MTAKQRSEAAEAVGRGEDKRDADMLHESGIRTWRRFTVPLLHELIGVECREVMGDNSHLTAVECS